MARRVVLNDDEERLTDRFISQRLTEFRYWTGKLRKLVHKVRQQERDAFAVLLDVADCGAEDIDPRLDYVTVQVDRELWQRVRALAGKETTS